MGGTERDRCRCITFLCWCTQRRERREVGKRRRQQSPCMLHFVSVPHAVCMSMMVHPMLCTRHGHMNVARPPCATRTRHEEAVFHWLQPPSLFRGYGCTMGPTPCTLRDHAGCCHLVAQLRRSEWAGAPVEKMCRCPFPDAFEPWSASIGAVLTNKSRLSDFQKLYPQIPFKNNTYSPRTPSASFICARELPKSEL